MTRFVEVEHPDLPDAPPGRVPESALEHWKKAGFRLVEEPAEDPATAPLPDGEPSLEWHRSELDNYAHQRLALDTTGEPNKAEVLATIQAAFAAQPDSTDTPAAGEDHEES